MIADMELSTLLGIVPADYTTTADGYRAAKNMADSAKDRINNQITKTLSQANAGEAADAALRQLRKLSENFHYIQVECGLITGALDGFASEITAPQQRLKNALNEANLLGCTINTANGAVTYPAGGKDAQTGRPFPGGTVTGETGFFSAIRTTTIAATASAAQAGKANPNEPKALEIADDIAYACQEAGEIDDRYSAALEKLQAPTSLNVTSKVWADAASDAQTVETAAKPYLAEHMPLDKSAAERHDWWVSLSDEQRAEYKEAFPDVIGNLDGVPSADRNEVNRANLPLLIAQLEGKRDAASVDKLAGLQGIQNKLDAGSQPPMYLLGVGLEGNGRAIVSYGNPDTARNVSAYVPGLGTKLDGDFADGDVKRAFETAKGAGKLDPSTASIVWLGYDAPQSADVMSAGDAERGAPAYDSFMSGISATNENPDPHITAIGHSYGSRLVGAATQAPGGIPGADDIILVGSPGTGVDKAEDLGVGKNHVWVGAAANDIVTHLPSPKEAEYGLIGAPAGPLGIMIGDKIADPHSDQLWFGTDPASKAFGANRFVTMPGPGLFHDSLTSPDVSAHSHYFSPDKDRISAKNIAAIVSGHTEKVIRTAPR
ncbi:alpha/beta hydrolase [Streptomyces sp. NPDC047022]|uniref:alpha/beta hydrolase n=1 Tax=Streptomyces sp. NPDC047022 TaxID=3155737 RepID=UPI0033D48505